MSQNTQQTLKTSLDKHPVRGPDANNPLFHDAAPKAPLPPHPPPPHLTPKETAHQTFEQRFKELADKGDASPPTPHPPHGSVRGRRQSGDARERARRRLQRMHPASPGHGRAGGSRLGEGERNTGGAEQRVTAAHERLAAKARHGQGLAAMAHQNHHAFHFPAYMVKNSADTEQVWCLQAFAWCIGCVPAHGNVGAWCGAGGGDRRSECARPFECLARLGRACHCFTQHAWHAAGWCLDGPQRRAQDEEDR